MIETTYHPLITEYFEAQKPFQFAHPETGEKTDFRIHGLDFGLDAGEIETKYFHEDREAGTAEGGALRFPISLAKLLDILENQA